MSHEFEYESVSIQFSVELPFDAVVERFLNSPLTKVTVKDNAAYFRTSEGFSVRVSKQEVASLTIISVVRHDEGIGSLPDSAFDYVRCVVCSLKALLGV